MNSTLTWLCGFAAGASAMYFLDPARGRARRARLRDTASSWAGQAETFAEKKARHLGNRAMGLMHETRKAVGAGAT
ncbi:MAG TPA: hypothetical protein VFG68_00745 [Fimbriiglobus sp.]|nr:hypothetical protein [Fimbriiglobus sp.]